MFKRLIIILYVRREKRRMASEYRGKYLFKHDVRMVENEWLINEFNMSIIQIQLMTYYKNIFDITNIFDAIQ